MKVKVTGEATWHFLFLFYLLSPNTLWFCWNWTEVTLLCCFLLHCTSWSACTAADSDVIWGFERPLTLRPTGFETTFNVAEPRPERPDRGGSRGTGANMESGFWPWCDFFPLILPDIFTEELFIYFCCNNHQNLTYNIKPSSRALTAVYCRGGLS